MRHNKFLLITLTLLLTLCLSVLVLAQANSRPLHGGEHQGGIFSQLGLTSEQQSQVQAIMVSERAVTKPILAAQFNDIRQTQNLIKSGSFNESQELPIAADQTAAQISLIVEHARVDSEIYAILTTDQQAKFDQLRNSSQSRQHTGGGSHFLDMLTSRLMLTTQQQEQIKGILADQETAIKPLLSSLADFHKQLLAITADGHFDEQQVTQLAQQQSTTFTNLTVARDSAMAKIYSLLTPDQQAKFFFMHGGFGMGMGR